MCDTGSGDSKMLFTDVELLVDEAITAMRRAEAITKTIEDGDLRAQAEDMIMSFWN